MLFKKLKYNYLTMQEVDRSMYITGIILLFITSVSWYFFNSYISKYFNVSCQFHAVTNLYCLGCGGTRAFRMLLSGHIIKALYYNIAISYFFILYTIYMIGNTIYILCGKFYIFKFKPFYIYIGLILSFINMLIKNALFLLCDFQM